MRAVLEAARWALIVGAGFWLGSFARPVYGVTGRYYSNLSRSGSPVIEVIDPEISTQTLSTGVAQRWPMYAVEWTGYIILRHSGTHMFATVSDDGSELEVADQVVVRNGGVHGPQEASGTIDLPAGVYPIRVRYEQAGGGLALEVRYAAEHGPATRLPRSMLTPERPSYWAFTLRDEASWVGGAVAIGLWAVAGRQRRRRREETWSAGTRWTVLDDPRVAVGIVIVFGAVTRIVMMLGSTGILWPDSEVFLTTAGAIHAGRYFEHDPFRTLIYPHYLAAMMSAFGATRLAGTLIVAGQQLMGIGAAVFTYLAGRRAIGPRAALAGALLLNVHVIQLFYEVSILSEALFVFTLALSLWIVLQVVERPSVAGAAAAGLACALTTLVRPVAQWWVIVVLAVLWWSPAPARRRGAMMAVAAGVTLLLLVPWMLLNRQQYGFTGIALGRGLGLFTRAFHIDQLPPAPGALPEVRAIMEFGRRRHLALPNFVRDTLNHDRRYSSAQTDELMYAFALAAVKEQPFTFARNSLRQWYVQAGRDLGGARICVSPRGEYLCSGRAEGWSIDPFPNAPLADREPVRDLVVRFVRYGYVRMGVVLPLAAFGMLVCFSRPQHRLGVTLLVLTIGYYTLVPALTQVPQDRFRLPVDGLLFMFAAAGAAGVVTTRVD